MFKSFFRGLTRNFLRCILLVGLLPASLCQSVAGTTEVNIRSAGKLRVCIWPDYYGVTYRNPHTGTLTGIDIDLSRAFAADLGVEPIYIDSSFATLVDDLLNDRCDISMFAVAILAQRAQQLAFSRPYLQSDIYAITTKSSRTVRTWSDIDQPGVVVGVQAGTFMEPIMRDNLKRATLVVLKPPATRERDLQAGRIDVFMSDYPYSRRLLDSADWVRVIEPDAPYHVLPYAYAVKPGDTQWLDRVNQFVNAIKQDGRLREAAQRSGLTPIVFRSP